MTLPSLSFKITPSLCIYVGWVGDDAGKAFECVQVHAPVSSLTHSSNSMTKYA